MIRGINVIILYDGNVLTGERMNEPWKAKLQFPGGKVEGNESDVHAAQREVLEECGVLLEAYKLKPLKAFKTRWLHGRYFVCQGFLYKANRKEALAIRNTEPTKNKYWAWLPPHMYGYRPPCQKLLNYVVDTGLI